MGEKRKLLQFGCCERIIIVSCEYEESNYGIPFLSAFVAGQGRDSYLFSRTLWNERP